MLFELALILIDGIGPVMARQLITHCGSAEAVFKESNQRLSKLQGVGPATLKALRTAQTHQRAEEEIRTMEKLGIRAVLLGDPKYPSRLRYCEDSPMVLFYKGDELPLPERMISVIGTRGITPYGMQSCKKIIEELAHYQPVIASGLALGVDTVAHKTALDCGLKTIAVLGHGLDRVYPAENRQLAEKICQQGNLFSEIFTGSQPDRQNFPMRNRIVAGMSQATIVIESGIKGGSMITANLAFDYNRDVIAVPGRITDKSFEGCNKLISTNRASVFTSTDDLVNYLGWNDQPAAPVQRALFTDLNADEELIVNYLRTHEKAGQDMMGLDLGINSGKMNALLLSMELKGIVQALPGKRYSL